MTHCDNPECGADLERDARIRREAILEVAQHYYTMEQDARRAAELTHITWVDQDRFLQAASRSRRTAAEIEALADSPPPASGGAEGGVPFATAADSPGLGGGDAVRLGVPVGSQAPPSTAVAAGDRAKIMLLVGAGDDLEAALNPLLVLNERETSKRRKHWRTVRDAIAAAPTRADSPPDGSPCTGCYARPCICETLSQPASPPIPPSEPRVSFGPRVDDYDLRCYARKITKPAARQTLADRLVLDLIDARAALAEFPEDDARLKGCGCRWEGDSHDPGYRQVQECALHAGMRAALAARSGEGAK